MKRVLGFIYAACAIGLVLWASGCGPSLYAQSAPPPGRTAYLEENDDHYDLELSQGVAIAVSCVHDGPCKDVVVSTADAAIADVKGAAFGTLERNPYTLVAAAPAGIVIIGKQPGKTKVQVKTAKGQRTIHVHVLPPPAVGEPATRAVAESPSPSSRSPRGVPATVARP